ncbi:MAG: TspO/MBR family protein [Halanaeroarchaeum sp.]
MDVRKRLWGLPRRRSLLALGIAIVIVELVGASGAIFTAMGLETWYGTLTRPTLAPPNWVFGPVWTALFGLMGVAVWLVWKAGAIDGNEDATWALTVFAIHFVVNLAWSGAFFGLQSLWGGMAVILVLWAFVVTVIRVFARIDLRAALLLVPYLLWVTFAAYLNYAFWLLN